MYFPSDMTFQYFFFDTYPGFFLQALPFALIAGILFLFRQRKRAPALPLGQAVLSSLFVCYFTGLLCITLFYYVIADLYYFLFYHMPSGSGFHWFNFEYYLIPDSFKSLNSENIGNILMFFPFGILYPFFDRHASCVRTVLAGAAVSVLIELLQPIFGRSFDINDIILNGLGAAASATVYFLLALFFRKKRRSS